jgi:hypothetical protein
MSLVRGINSIIKTLILGLIFMFLFAIIGVSLFKGLFYYCDMTNIPSYAQNVVTIYDCYSLGGEWRNQDATYDSMWLALLNLFENFTQENWLVPMFNAMDIVDLDKQPQYFNNPGACVFSLVVIICLFFFIRNIFTGVVSDTFSKEKDILMLGTELVTIQRRWVKLYKQIYKVSPAAQVIYLFIYII